MGVEPNRIYNEDCLEGMKRMDNKKDVAMYHLIYKITNNINGMIYIGKHSTNNPNDKYMGSGIKIKEAIRNFGVRNFTKEVICFCNEEELDEKEIYYIRKYKSIENGYNIAMGGKGLLGVKMKESTKKKSSESRKRYYKEHPEARKRLSEMFSKRVGPLNSFYGKKLTREHIEKMTKARIKAISGIKNKSAKAVRCVETGEVFPLAKLAAAHVGLKYSTLIIKCCRRRIEKAAGYHWQYA